MKGVQILRVIRTIVVTVLGAVLVVAGVVMLVTPGPGLVAIAAGLAVLATEFDWARDLRDRARHRLRGIRHLRSEPLDHPELTRQQVASRERAA